MSETIDHQYSNNFMPASGDADRREPAASLSGQAGAVRGEGTEAPLASISEWLFGNALPFWSVFGVDRTHGGFVEELRLDGANPNVSFKRTRVQARQIYVYSHAAQLGVPGASELAEFGYRFLTSNAWAGNEVGWRRQLTIDGRPLDDTADLYDLSFVLFALGWYYRATGERDAIAWTRKTLNFIFTHMRHPSRRGFLATNPAKRPRLQNPHMHLLEAALNVFEATQDESFLDLADEIVALFTQHFFDERSGTLPEFFTEDLRPFEGDLGNIIEPGHQFEWAWLLAWYQRLKGRDMRDYVRALVSFAENYGVDPATGSVFDTVRNDGTVLDRGERAWPAAERLQAAAAMFELFGETPLPVFTQSASRLLTKHLAHTPKGTWIDHFDERGKPKVGKIPASTLYHLMIAITEMLRVKDAAVRAAAKLEGVRGATQ